MYMVTSFLSNSVERVSSYGFGSSDVSSTFEGVLDLLLTSIGAVYSFFTEIFTSLGAFPFFVTMFVVFTVVRLILVPFMGNSITSAASDAVKLKKASDVRKEKAESEQKE